MIITPYVIITLSMHPIRLKEALCTGTANVSIILCQLSIKQVFFRVAATPYELLPEGYLASFFIHHAYTADKKTNRIPMSGLQRGGTAEPSRETKFSGANGDKEKTFFPVQLTSRRTGNHIQL